MHDINIRIASPGDPAVAHLAALDSADAPAGHTLVAEIAGRAVAAISYEGDAVVADPFARTADIVSVLAERSGQLRGGGVAGSLRAWRRGERRPRARTRVVPRGLHAARPVPSIQGAALQAR